MLVNGSVEDASHGYVDTLNCLEGDEPRSKQFMVLFYPQAFQESLNLLHINCVQLTQKQAKQLLREQTIGCILWPFGLMHTAAKHHFLNIVSITHQAADISLSYP